MKTEKTLKQMAALFLSLADGTRLRLLNLMRNGEVCVSSFTEILGQSQPKISRHLAYLRGAGLVEARREGKWMHYSVAAGLDEKSRLLLDELFKWMHDQEALSRDTEKYVKSGLPVRQVLFAPEPSALAEDEQLPPPKPRRAKRERAERVPPNGPQPAYVEPEPVYVEPRHNELEDFLL
jgi:ArsR family transcriptional regulator